MKLYDEADLDDLAAMNGYILTDVEGNEVEIADDDDLYDFIDDYIEEYGLEQLLDRLGYESVGAWVKDLEDASNLESKVCKAFGYEDAIDLLPDDGADEKYAQWAGK